MNHHFWYCPVCDAPNDWETECCPNAVRTVVMNEKTKICSWCGPVVQGASVNHGICPECASKHFPSFNPKRLNQNREPIPSLGSLPSNPVRSTLPERRGIAN